MYVFKKGKLFKLRSTLAHPPLKEEHPIPFFVIVYSLRRKTNKIKKRLAIATMVDDVQISRFMETSHNKDKHSKPRAAVGLAAVRDTLVCAFRSYPTYPFIPPLLPSSCPLPPTGPELVTAQGIQLTSVTVSSVSFALTQRQ